MESHRTPPPAPFAPNGAPDAASQVRGVRSSIFLPLAAAAARSPIIRRFWEKVDRGGPDECWPWLGYLNEHGYGRFSIGSRATRSAVPAHRAAWELHHKRPFPADKVACHSCDNPACCNPLHIWPGTQRENLLDACLKGRMRNQIAERMLA